jgi:hypothetical protein
MKKIWENYREKIFVFLLIISYDEIQRKSKEKKEFDVFDRID